MTPDQTPEPDREKQKGNGPSKATRLAGYALDNGVELWSTPEGDAYLDARSPDGALWCAPVHSMACGDYLTRLMLKEEGTGVGQSAITEAQQTLGAIARGPKSPEMKAHIRVAPAPEAVHIDMGRADWRIIRVDASGWEILDEMPEGIRFRRPRHARAMPDPVRASGGGWAQLRRLMGGLEHDNPAFVLAASWLLGTLSPGPYPLLAITGEQGSGKSTTADILRLTVDPHGTGRRQPPKDDKDLGSSANNAHVLCFDNVSTIPEWLSDGLAAVATGRSFASRRLYTDFEEASVTVLRPVILTSIPTAVTRDDLADRTIPLELPQIPPSLRVSEKRLRDDIEKALPMILGDLLDAASASIRHRADLPETGWPRMADFAQWVAAAERGETLPWPVGTFRRVYDEARENLTDAVLDADPIGLPLLDFLEGNPVYEGTASQLLEDLTSITYPNGRPPRHWPSHPKALTTALKRLTPALRSNGWEIEKRRERDRRLLIFARIPEPAEDLTDETPADAEAIIRAFGDVK